MTDQLRRWCWGVAARMRIPLPALHYHHAALVAAQERDFTLAGWLFDRAVAAYRASCDVERLAHARIHQLFVSLAARGPVVTILESEGPSDRINRLRLAEHPGAVAGTVEPGQQQRRGPLRDRGQPEELRPAA